MDKVGVSVIVPVYKVEPYLRKCVESILRQTHTDFDLILVDDGSPDGCGLICDQYAAKDSRVHVIHQMNGGLSAARNAGIDWVMANAKSEYLCFVDSDDWVDSNYLERLIEGVASGAEIACTSLARVHESGIEEFCPPDRGWRLMTPEQYWIRPDGAKDVSVAKLYAKCLFPGIRYPLGKTNEDMFTTYRLVFSARRIACRDIPTYKYLKRTNSITTSAEYAHKISVVEAMEGQLRYFRENRFPAAAEYARGQVVAWKLLTVELLGKDGLAKAISLRSEIDEVLRKEPLSFWPNRGVYRQIRPWRFRLQWPFAMLWNAVSTGRDSWLVREMIPLARRLWIEWRGTHKGGR